VGDGMSKAVGDTNHKSQPLSDILVERYLVVERDYSVQKISCGSKDSNENEISRSSSSL